MLEINSHFSVPSETSKFEGTNSMHYTSTMETLTGIFSQDHQLKQFNLEGERKIILFHKKKMTLFRLFLEVL